MEYTKGEWKVQEVIVQEYGGAIKHYYITGFIGSKTDRTVADVGCWSDRYNALEDAHLIAAAPDMYEALQAMVNVRPGRFALAKKALAKSEGIDIIK